MFWGQGLLDVAGSAGGQLVVPVLRMNSVLGSVAGFGCVCTVSTCYWPFFTQAAVIAMIYPLFILVACKSDPLAAYKRGDSLQPNDVEKLLKVNSTYFTDCLLPCWLKWHPWLLPV